MPTNANNSAEKLTDFQAIQFKLADMTMELESARWLIYRAAANATNTIADRYESSVCKVVSAEMAIHVTNAAMQLLGGNGYSRERPFGTDAARCTHVHLWRWQQRNPTHRHRLAHFTSVVAATPRIVRRIGNPSYSSSRIHPAQFSSPGIHVRALINSQNC